MDAHFPGTAKTFYEVSFTHSFLNLTNLHGCTFVFLQDILPPGYTHHVCSINESTSDNVGYACEVLLRLPLQDETAFSKWLKDFESSSLMTWRVLQNYKTSGKYVTFKVGITTHYIIKVRNGEW